jgi:virginiamycin A acetyltransferase
VRISYFITSLGERIEKQMNSLFKIYRFGNHHTRRLIRAIICRREGGDFYSRTLREIFSKYYGVEIGLYTAGGCFDLYMVDPHTRIGRYCSFAKGVRIINHNHPLDFKSTSALFFNPSLGFCKEWLVKFNPLEVGNDVWIGANAVILPEVSRIGDGAVIGAGAVVNRDVPPFAVVLGNPARIVKYRFSELTIRRLLEEKWWQKDIEDLSPGVKSFQQPIEMNAPAE